MGVEILVPLGFFAMIVAIVLVPSFYKSRERAEMQQTVRHALDKGQPLPPELVDAIARSTKRPATAHTDLRTGVIWVAIALGVATFGYATSYVENEAMHPLMGIAAIPGFIGLAFIILSFFNKTKD
ncbi:DUF6249 domain-containing protein [Brevundimonas sp.]|uniref:DUF6249 domain-containing protein n=1 Tax=Brevundimonas sp. TaxID=1871086 RepID=UPI0025E05F45|nr:DUF6249 domain-containing protein [Brevundimonas sp.]